MSNIQIKFDSTTPLETINKVTRQVTRNRIHASSWGLMPTSVYWIPIDNSELKFGTSTIVASKYRHILTILDVKDGKVLINPIVKFTISVGDIIGEI